MAQLPHGPFDSSKVEPNAKPEALPAGQYVMEFVASEMKPTASGNGQRLVLTAKVLDGEQKGRQVWEGLNLINPNQQAVDISYGVLSAICRAVGKPMIQDSAELHNLPFLAKVDFIPATGNYKAKNEIAEYLPATAGAASAAAAPAAAPANGAIPAATPAKAGPLPWQTGAT